MKTPFFFILDEYDIEIFIDRWLLEKVSFCREAPILIKAVVSIELSFSPRLEQSDSRESSIEALTIPFSFV